MTTTGTDYTSNDAPGAQSTSGRSDSNGQPSAQSGLRLLAAALMGVVAVLMFLVASHNQNSVNSQLAFQGLRFPAAGSPQFAPAQFPTVQKYAGQLVDSGPRAEAYANGYLTPYLRFATSGLSPAQVATAAANDPTNATLQMQAAQVFAASTTRTLLLAAGTASSLARDIFYLAIALAIGAALMLISALRSLSHSAMRQMSNAKSHERSRSTKPTNAKLRTPTPIS